MARTKQKVLKVLREYKKKELETLIKKEQNLLNKKQKLEKQYINWWMKATAVQQAKQPNTLSIISSNMFKQYIARYRKRQAQKEKALAILFTKK